MKKIFYALIKRNEEKEEDYKGFFVIGLTAVFMLWESQRHGPSDLKNILQIYSIFSLIFFCPACLGYDRPVYLAGVVLQALIWLFKRLIVVGLVVGFFVGLYLLSRNAPPLDSHAEAFIGGIIIATILAGCSCKK